MDSEPIFPADLEREIFETAARMHPGRIPTFLRVARRVLVWIEPLLYRVVLVNSRKAGMVHALLNAMTSKPPQFFHAVRYLAVESSRNYPSDDLKRLLSLCKGLTNFTCVHYFSDPTLLPILSELRIQRLFLYLPNLFGTEAVDLTCPFFPSITHLEMTKIELQITSGHLIVPACGMPALGDLAC
ncbi:hypothetical protein B0H19DRAFT_184937 [Mycena capillaripes]|nr:hypothetical protein B0H19DRAFT_184937 [Mycena capillaripes]